MATQAHTARAAEEERPTAHRYVLLDGLRGLAATTIIIHHFTADTGHGELFASASISVDFFFCLSGFVIAHAYHDRLLHGMSLASYAIKRMSRLYPMYLIGTLLGLVGILLLKGRGLTDHTYDSIAKATALNLAYLPYFNWNYVDVFSYRLVGTIFPLNNPAWSLFFGVLANLFYAASLKVSRRTPLVWLSLAAVGLCLATAVYGEAPGWGTGNVLGGLPRVMYSFFAGVVLFQFRGALGGLPRMYPAAIVLLVAVLAIMPRFPGHKIYWLLSALLVVPGLVALGSRCDIRPGGMARRLCVYSGRISYPLFCLHYPMLMFFSLLPREHGKMELLSVNFLSFATLATAFFFSTIVVSHYAMERIEDPMRVWLTGLRLRA